MKLLSSIHLILASMLLSVVVASCSHEEEVLPAPGPDNGEPRQLELYLTVGSTATQASRAPQGTGGDYDAGQGYENYIDVENYDFRFYFFDSDNKYLASLEIGVVIPIGGTETSKTYYAKSFATDEAVTGSVKVVALANWPEYPDEGTFVKGVTTIDDLVTMQYDFDASKMKLSDKVTIPLFGVTNPMTLSYNENNLAYIGTIHMLRAYAKVEINLHPDCPFAMDNVRLKRYNSRGFCAPGGVYREGDYVHNSYGADYTGAPSVPTEAEIDEYLPFIKVDDSQWIAYIPEYANVGRTASERSGMELHFSGEGYSEDVRLEFATYKDDEVPNTPGRYFNVMRNYYYKYTVNKRDIYTDLECQVDVQPYGLVELKPDFGLERNADGDIVIRDKEGNVVKIVQVGGAELTFKPFEVEAIGPATGVFDEKNHVQLAYLPDGRMIVYTYASSDRFKIDMTSSQQMKSLEDELIRWEIYSNEDKAGDNFVNSFFIEEEYEKWRYDWADDVFWPGNYHSYYDDGGTLIERYAYVDDDAFKKRPAGGDSSDATVAINYTGDRYGDKVVTYYHTDSKGVLHIPMQITVTKVYKQKLDNNKDPMWEIDHYEYDADGNPVLDDKGKPIPVYATDKNGNKIPVKEYRYEEVYNDNVPDPPQAAGIPARR